MAGQPCAVKVKDENISVILSEAGKRLDRKRLLAWKEEFGEGYFLRDEASPLDCNLFAPDVFEHMYHFINPNDVNALFRAVIQK